MKCPVDYCEVDDLATVADLQAHLEDEHTRANAGHGGRCEDFPCCGHEAGDCPVFSDESGFLPYPCLSCGKRIRRGSRDDASSSYCSGCLVSGRFSCTCGDEDGGPCDYHDRLAEREQYDEEDEESEREDAQDAEDFQGGDQ